jgi:glycolate oxidase
MIAQTILSQVKSIVGKEHYFDSPEQKLVYSYDGTPLISQLPQAIVRPQNKEQIQKLLILANNERFAIVPRGSGTGLSGGSIPVENSIVLLMNHWKKIIEIDKNNHTAWIEPGVITADLQNAVESIDLFYPPDPGSASISTIGGNVAENAGGIRGLKYGVTKNYVLGMEVILPNGEPVILGGKSVKDVAGYNLKDLLIGSEGTLGVFSRILVRLLIKPEASSTISVCFNSLTDVAETIFDIISKRINPSALELLDNTTIKCVEDYVHLDLPVMAEALLFIEVDGHRAVVEEDTDQIKIICQKHNASDFKIAGDKDEANRLRSARKVAFSALARVKPTTILEDATVPRSEILNLLNHVHSTAKKYSLSFGNFGHAGDGNLHPTCLTDERDKNEIQRAEKAFHDIFYETVKLGGTITGEHGVGLAKRQFFEELAPPPALEMMRQVKNVLDPNSVLNPGKIFSIKPKCEGSLPKNQEMLKKYLDAGAYS